ncbi:MAG: YggS family pyridoxal phosphate-dependent enzyme [Firmicutes bacterium]|jgi:pyridoxal phosphate enzyme (YggS family)|nr:YggS family pyridoxal phosphate-dependent enzyme [Bacillota bacterium]HBG09058.1 YggS family pyridoxal phosphate-dependent enzyme [Bacillota bacterium]
MGIRENLASVQARIRQAAHRSGRAEGEIRLLGVTKYASDEQVKELMAAGLLLFGENKVQDARKRLELFPEAEWHFIGTLQTNKVRYCESFALIHSVDRWSLAETLNARAAKWGKRQDVLIQVNVAREKSKRGLAPDEVSAFVERVLRECPQLNVRGLMTMAPLVEPEEARPVFRETRLLYERLQAEFQVCWDTLSMGMTNDFEVAIEEGATLVRIGSALFAKEE